MALHKKLAQLRKINKLSQLDVAEKLAVSRQAISKWETGMAAPSADNLKCLGELYGVSVDYLLNDDLDEICECFDECDCDECDECEDDVFMYDVKCPKCENVVCIDEDTLLQGDIDCPNCGEKLEFEFDEE